LSVTVYHFVIKELATSRGLNIASLSRVSNVPIKTIRNVWHNPRYPLPMDAQERIAKALNVSIRDLYEETNE
jgi:transcriptional regulator with XRE-family HTH domain